MADRYVRGRGVSKKRSVREGFTERSGKGDHTVFSHPLVAKHYAVDGRDSLDAQRYDEKNLLDARRELDEALKRQQERDL